MPVRLQCDVCKEKSVAVENPAAVSPEERLAVAAFKAAHDASCRASNVIAVAPQNTCGPFGAAKPAPLSARKPHGHFHRTGPYGEQEEGDTLSCCHCRRHFEVRAGSGKTRGWCSQCAAVTCGLPACDTCLPFEARLANAEAGRPILMPLPASVLVPTLNMET